MANIGAPYRSELLAPGNGSRSPVGYFLKFDAAMLNREIWRLLSVRMPQRKIEVSAM